MNGPPTACSTPGCPGYVESGGKCKECKPGGAPAAPAVPAEKPHDYHRIWKKLYNTMRWKRLREAILRRDIICMECKRYPSVIADHITDHRGDLTLFYNPNNLRGLCKACHDAKTGSQHGPGDRTPFKPALEDGCIRDHWLDKKKDS